MKARDLTNQKFGRLLAIEFAGSRRTSGGASIRTWECLCDCGEKRSRHFPTAKYGKEEAFRLACEFRNNAVAEFNIEKDARFSEFHGKGRTDLSG